MKKLIELDTALDALMIAKTVETSVTGYASNAGVDWCIDTIKALPTVDAVPCDVCRFAPPSSGDGKPCTICPAEEKDGDTDGV